MLDVLLQTLTLPPPLLNVLLQLPATHPPTHPPQGAKWSTTTTCKHTNTPSLPSLLCSTFYYNYLQIITNTSLPPLLNVQLPANTHTDTPLPPLLNVQLPANTHTDTPLPPLINVQLPANTHTDTPLPPLLNVQLPANTHTDTPLPPLINVQLPANTHTDTPSLPCSMFNYLQILTLTSPLLSPAQCCTTNTWKHTITLPPHPNILLKLPANTHTNTPSLLLYLAFYYNYLQTLSLPPLSPAQCLTNCRTSPPSTPLINVLLQQTALTLTPPPPPHTHTHFVQCSPATDCTHSYFYLSCRINTSPQLHGEVVPFAQCSTTTDCTHPHF